MSSPQWGHFWNSSQRAMTASFWERRYAGLVGPLRAVCPRPRGPIGLHARREADNYHGAMSSTNDIQTGAPYPGHREADVALRDGSTVHVRPVRRDDEPALLQFLEA